MRDRLICCFSCYAGRASREELRIPITLFTLASPSCHLQYRSDKWEAGWIRLLYCWTISEVIIVYAASEADVRFTYMSSLGSDARADISAALNTCSTSLGCILASPVDSIPLVRTNCTVEMLAFKSSIYHDPSQLTCVEDVDSLSTIFPTHNQC